MPRKKINYTQTYKIVSKHAHMKMTCKTKFIARATFVFSLCFGVHANVLVAKLTHCSIYPERKTEKHIST